MTATPHTPRRVLTDPEWLTACQTTANRTGLALNQAADALAAGLATLSILTPPPLLDDDTCTAVCPDDQGDWWQCGLEPGHQGAHDCGDLAWTDDHPDAVPPAASSGSPVGAREDGAK